jgi:DNA-binding transcriptional ArsR family regulator
VPTERKIYFDINIYLYIYKEAPLVDGSLHSLAFLAKSLADENRLRILLCLKNGRKSVSRIVEELNLSQPLVSHHLKELRRSLLVKVERKGPFIYYEISDARILDILKDLEDLSLNLLAARKTF